jgi:hypothetical protein
MIWFLPGFLTDAPGAPFVMTSFGQASAAISAIFLNKLKPQIAHEEALAGHLLVARDLMVQPWEHDRSISE